MSKSVKLCVFTRKENFVFVIYTSKVNSMVSKDYGTVILRGELTQAEEQQDSNPTDVFIYLWIIS